MYFINPFKGLRPTEKEASSVAITSTDHLSKEISQYALNELNVDENGLDEMDNRILSALIDKFAGGPVGMTTLATAIGENAGTLEEVYEPFLIQEGLLVRTQRGRQATKAAFEHLGRTPSAKSGSLFD